MSGLHQPARAQDEMSANNNNNSRPKPPIYDTIIARPTDADLRIDRAQRARSAEARPTSQPITSNVEPPEGLDNQPRWGTAIIGQFTELSFWVTGHGEPLRVALKERLVIGRHITSGGERPDVVLDDFEAHQKGVSRRHAVLVMEDDTLKVIDLGSTNGTFLNGHRLVPQQSRILRNGDQLRLGHLALEVRFEGAPDRARTKPDSKAAE